MITLRKAEGTDCRQLFEWVNAPDSIAASLQTSGQISWPSHCEWFNARLNDPGSHIWIVELSGAPIGQLRLQDRGNGPEVAIYLEAGKRGSGYASDAMRLAQVEARRVFSGRMLLARVRVENHESNAFFMRLGFERADSDPVSNLYRLQL